MENHSLIGRILRGRSIISSRVRRLRTQRLFNKYELEIPPNCLCGGQEFQTIAEFDRYRLPVGVKLCMRCGIGIQSPRLTEKSLNIFYEKDYRKLLLGTNDIGQDDFDRGHRRGEKILGFLKNHNQSFDNKTVVEIGSGSGGILKCFQDHNSTVYGCEVDRQCLAISKKMGINTVSGTIEMFVAKNIRADLVILSHILEHLPRPFDFLSTLHKILTKDATVYIQLPGTKNESKNFFRGMQVAHLYYYDLSTLTWMMDQAGFVLISGDETVQSIFRAGNSMEKISVDGNFERNLTIIQNWGEMGRENPASQICF